MSNKAKRTVLTNTLSLFALQGMNYLLPLLTVPYLLRTVGIQKVGLLAFATATTGYFQVLADYGFAMSATRKISINRNDKTKLGEIVSSVWTIQSFLILAGFLLMLLLVSSVNQLRQDAEIYFYSFGIVLGHALFPSWFFQGMEKMKFITYLSIGSKFIFTAAIFVLVKKEDDYYLVPILSSAGGLFVTILAFVIIKNRFGIRLKIQSIKTLKIYLREGWHVFTSRIYLNIYMSTNIVLLGFLTNTTIVGFYSIAEKMIGAICSLFDSANQAIYPYLAKIHEESFTRFFRITNKITICFFSASLFAIVIGYLASDHLIFLVAGKEERQIAAVFSILLATLIARPLGTLFSNILVVIGEAKSLNEVMRSTSVLSLMTAPIAIWLFQARGLAAIAVMLFVFVALRCRRKLILYIKANLEYANS